LKGKIDENICANFQKLPQVNNHPMGENSPNSPNLVTLNRFHFFQFGDRVLKKKRAAPRQRSAKPWLPDSNKKFKFG
jgi:hypothetical protein